MAKVLSNQDFVGNQIQNAVAQPLAAAPTSPKAGQFWFNTTTGRFEFRGNAANIDPTARVNHTGTQTANTISDFDTQVRTSRLDQMAVPTADVALNSRKITGLANGTATTDAVNRSQLDAVQSGVAATRLDQFAAPTAAVSLNNQQITNLADGTANGHAATWGQVQALVNGMDWKASVRAATTGNVALTGLQTIDGVTLAAGQRVLVKNNTNPVENGIYVVATGAWTRAPDAGVGQLTPNTSVFVEEGTANADTQWHITTNGTITIGTTAIAWSQIGASVTLTADGTTIQIVGNEIRAKTDTARSLARKFFQSVGDGSATTFAITHNLATYDVIVCVYASTGGEEVIADITRTSDNVVTVGFAVAPTSNQYRVVIIG